MDYVHKVRRKVGCQSKLLVCQRELPHLRLSKVVGCCNLAIKQFVTSKKHTSFLHPFFNYFFTTLALFLKYLFQYLFPNTLTVVYLGLYICCTKLPNSRFEKLPSPAIDWKIWKALYWRGCLASRLVGCVSRSRHF